VNWVPSGQVKEQLGALWASEGTNAETTEILTEREHCRADEANIDRVKRDPHAAWLRIRRGTRSNAKNI